MRLATALLVPALLLAAAGCATQRLPDSAMPHVAVREPGTAPPPQAFTYRILTPDDFQASAPPAAYAAHARVMGAMTCARVAPAPGTRVAYAHGPHGAGYVARPEAVSFRAEFDPACSWWNREPLPVPSEQILQHEQIHFALIELAARRTTERARAFAGEGASPDAAARDFQSRVQDLLHEIAGEILKEQTRFDQETSGQLDPTAQNRWWGDVSARLERTRP